MALSNLIGWIQDDVIFASGTGCGSEDKPAEMSASCGASDEIVQAPTACGTVDK